MAPNLLPCLGPFCLLSPFFSFFFFFWAGGEERESQLLSRAKRMKTGETVGLTEKMASHHEIQFFQTIRVGFVMTSNFMGIFVHALRIENQYAYRFLCDDRFVLYTHARNISLEEFSQVRFPRGWWLDRKFGRRSPVPLSTNKKHVRHFLPLRLLFLLLSHNQLTSFRMLNRTPMLSFSLTRPLVVRRTFATTTATRAELRKLGVIGWVPPR